MTFSDLALDARLMQAVSEEGYKTPSPIQAQAIPAVLSGRDVMAMAQTGTGKTAGFVLPILQRLLALKPAAKQHTLALILAPTRELAAQIQERITAYAQYTALRSSVVFGGVKIGPQVRALTNGKELLVATPGRLLDLHQQQAIHFTDLEVLVLDEADRMLDMGFIHDIRKILALLPKRRQNLLFSATFTEAIRKLANSVVTNPLEISVTPRNTTAKRIQQIIHPVDKNQKSALLCHLIANNQWQQVLVFSRTKHGADRLSRYLNNANIHSAAIHGNKSQNARTKALAKFKEGTIRVLVATDIAARGIDIEQLPHVVNFDLPEVPEDYVHRIGRTGRAGAEGHAVSLVCADEIKKLRAIEKLTKLTIKRILINGFEPIHAVPESFTKSKQKVQNKPKGQHDKSTKKHKHSSDNPKSKRGNNSRRKKKITRSRAQQYRDK